MDNNNKKNILILSFSPLELARDPRIFRQITFLSEDYKVTAFGNKNPKVENLEHFDSGYPKNSLLTSAINLLLLILGLFEKYYWRKNQAIHSFKVLKEKTFDLIIANDFETIPIAVKLAENNKAKILFDDHEFAPYNFNTWFMKWTFGKFSNYVLDKYLKDIDKITTVSYHLAKEYQKRFSRKADVISNSPFYIDLVPEKIQNNKIKIIHHGLAAPDRQIESIIKLMDKLDDRFELYLMLLSIDQKYYNSLVDLSKKNNKVKILEPVSMQEISKTINQFDIGIFFFEPQNLSHHYGVYNKFYEYIQARLAIAIGPYPEMAEMVNKYQLGIVSDDFTIESMAEKITQLNEEMIIKFKENSNYSARELSAEKNKELLHKYVKELIGE